MIEQSSSSWLYCRIPRTNARMRLVCFPPAGGTTVHFFAWADVLPPDVELHIAQLPGRERRRHEPPVLEAETLLGKLTSAIEEIDELPLAFYGHSMGALLAFEAARRRHLANLMPPVHLFVAGRRAPHIPWPDVPIHRMSDAEFARELQHRWGALPRTIAENKELLDYFLPIIRTDITVLETYTYHAGPPLPCRVTVYGGQADPSTTVDDLKAWKQHTTSDFRLRLFDGDHFFPQSLRSQLLEDIAECLGSSVTQSA
jgi:medium-chain acyl-[acyl-carrier-protein] hydrolase